jgi:hypothetical protein
MRGYAVVVVRRSRSIRALDAMNNETNFESQRDALITEITAAFDRVSREDGTTLHEAKAIDDWKTPQEQQAAREFDTEQRWQDVPDDDILVSESALSFLDAKGFRYYLPAFMLCGLKDWENDSSGILHSCEYHLLHESQKSLRKSEPKEIAAKYKFTNEQCRAIANFLRFVVGEDDEFTRAERPILLAVEKWEKYVEERSSVNEGI